MINTLFPALNALDGWLDFLPLALRCLLFGLIAGAGSMLVYLKSSNQPKIAALKAEAADIRGKLLNPKLDPALMPALIKRNLAASFGLLGRVLGPALLSALPTLLLMAWLDSSHGYALPGAQGVALHTVPEGGMLQVEPATRALSDNGTLHLLPPDDAHGANAAITLSLNGQQIYYGNPYQPPTPGIGKRESFNLLLASEAGYLAEDAPIEAVLLDFPSQRVIGSGPAWLGSWALWFFAGTLISALGLKFALKIA